MVCFSQCLEVFVETKEPAEKLLEFISKYAKDPHRRVRYAAINAVGIIGTMFVSESASIQICGFRWEPRGSHLDWSILDLASISYQKAIKNIAFV